MLGNLGIFNDLGVPTLPSPLRTSFKMHGNLCICNYSGFPTFPSPLRKSWNMLEIQTFSMSLGFPRFLLHQPNHENVWISSISNDYGFPAFPSPLRKSWKIHGNLGIFNDSGFPTLSSPLGKSCKNAWKSNWGCYETPQKENPIVSARDYTTCFPSFVFICISLARGCRKRLWGTPAANPRHTRDVELLGKRVQTQSKRNPWDVYEHDGPLIFCGV